MVATLSGCMQGRKWMCCLSIVILIAGALGYLWALLADIVIWIALTSEVLLVILGPILIR